MDSLLTSHTAVVLLAVGALAAFDLSQRLRHRNFHLLFAVTFGSICSAAIIAVGKALLTPGAAVNAYLATLVVLLLVLGWKALFGPWEPEAKAAVLGTFLFWIGLIILGGQNPKERYAHLIAGAVAFVPALIWCSLFLKYHTERRAAVLLLFLSGMLATVPILFYDALVRHHIELSLFLGRIVPEGFHQTTDAFVRGSLGLEGLRAVLAASFGAFLVVGLIEECSKYWVVRRSGARLFSSIDDVLQLSIIAAIGFSFAENIVNPTYFQSFVQQYLLQPGKTDALGFVSNVLGRSVLTSMVHIVSTGVMGYFLGLAIFAHPYLLERRSSGARLGISGVLARVLRVREERIFRGEMVVQGILIAVMLHGTFNFLVTVSDLLPSQPQTVGDLLGATAPAVLQSIPLLLIPALLYVVGGFWLLTWLFLLKENAKERVRVDIEEVGA
ncbi:MAG: Uncharacterized protein G01um101425_885 [Candidatus Peregrinibacteria bacterium Gr01-1014_25]|nr:MAG: Uncharacterized protein G01um101425_885 [Candidatus Peregrinibacteria bacterium Gr01-1014_25]